MPFHAEEKIGVAASPERRRMQLSHEAIPERLRYLRQRLRLSQSALGERLGVSRLTVLRWEQGQAQPSSLALRQLRRLERDSGAANPVDSASPPSAWPATGVPASPSAALAKAATASVLSLPPMFDLAPGSRFVGRGDELRLLQGVVEAAGAGHGRLLFTAGEPGIGKTRVLQELAGRAGKQGAVVLWGRCFEGDWVLPYSPWAEALTACIGAMDTESLGRELGHRMASLAQIVPSLQTHWPEAPSVAGLAPAEARLRLYDAVTQLLLGAAHRRPLLLVLDDLHWADHGSLDLLCFVARFTPGTRILLAGAYRNVGIEQNHLLGATLATLRREPGYASLHLEGLSRSETDALIADELDGAVPDEIARAIHDGTNGNPFFVRELTQVLHRVRGRDGLHMAQVPCRPATPDEQGILRALGVPEGVRQVVDQRLQHLTPDTARLLRLACGLSGGFEPQSWRHCALARKTPFSRASMRPCRRG